MSTTGPDEPPLLPAAHLPPRVEQHLRRSLEVLRDQARDPAVRGRIEAVLQGRASMRELARDEGFSAMMTPLVERGMARMEALSPEERARAAADAEALERGEPVQAERDAEREDERQGPTPPRHEPGAGQGTW